jgi:nucleoside-diphosphate-sugar epimerase
MKKSQNMLQLLKDDFDEIWEENIPWEKLDNKCVLVTGASGLIGSCFVYALLDRNLRYDSNIHIIVLARNRERLWDKFGEFDNVNIIAQDVSVEIKLSCNVDYIIHAACDVQPITTSGNPVGICKTILEGTFSVCDFAYQVGAKVVNISSINAFGRAYKEEPFSDEECVNIPLNDGGYAYHEGKRMSEMICASYAAQHHMKYSVLRIGRVYGPTMNTTDSMVLSSFLLEAATGHDLILKSRGTQRYTYVYVADVVSALFYLMFFGEAKYYNCGEAAELEERNLGEIVQLICDVNHVQFHKAEMSSDEKQIYSKTVYCMMTSENLMELRWKKKNNIVRGIKKTSNILRCLYGNK